MPSNPTLDYYIALHTAARVVLETALADSGSVSRSHSEEIADISAWHKILGNRAEAKVLENATREFSFGLYALLTGSYRNAFASLRLVLEQSLLSVFFSVNPLELAEWHSGGYDTNWAALTGDAGVFSQRYARCFFPELEDEARNYSTKAKRLYRELSEFVHGNKNSWDLAPRHIQFDQGLTTAWLEKAAIAVETIAFAFVLRLTNELDPSNKAEIAERTLSRLGHIEAIRVAYGGVPNSL